MKLDNIKRFLSDYDIEYKLQKISFKKTDDNTTTTQLSIYSKCNVLSAAVQRYEILNIQMCPQLDKTNI